MVPDGSPMDYQELACAFETKSEADHVATFSGIASTCDVDLANDIIEAGAFDPIARKANGDPDVLMLRDHDRTQVIGGWKHFAQSGRQLHVEGELCLEVEKARETYALLKRGFLSGLSVGYTFKRGDVTYDTSKGGHRVRKATLRECSIVARPANNLARVTAVKADLAEAFVTCSLSESDVDMLVTEGLDALIDFNMPRNARQYTSDQVDKIKARIVAAWKRKIDKDGPPSASDKGEIDLPSFLDVPMDALRLAHETRALLSQMKGRCHG